MTRLKAPQAAAAVDSKAMARVHRAALLAVPALAILFLFQLWPLLSVVRYATWEWSGLAEPVSVGTAQFARLVGDVNLWRSLGVTGMFTAITLPTFLLLSIVIAMGIEGLRHERLIKALLFLPGLITVGGSAIAWYLLYNPDYGLVVELTGLSLPWSSEPWAALLYIVLFSLWQQTGFGVLVVSAALRGIPKELKEAAWLDGASESQVQRLVTLPLLKPTMLFLLVIGTVLAIQSYTAVFLLTRGGPFGATRVLGYYLYETAFERFQLGYGAAITLFVMALTLIVAIMQVRVFAARRPAQAGA